jgi:hypothetical protein
MLDRFLRGDVMKIVQPFLLRFRTRQKSHSFGGTKYDWELDQLVVREGDNWTAAINSSLYALESKKADIEKGEDQKGP